MMIIEECLNDSVDSRINSTGGTSIVPEDTSGTNSGTNLCIKCHNNIKKL